MQRRHASIELSGRCPIYMLSRVMCVLRRLDTICLNICSRQAWHRHCPTLFFPRVVRLVSSRLQRISMNHTRPGWMKVKQQVLGAHCTSVFLLDLAMHRAFSVGKQVNKNTPKLIVVKYSIPALLNRFALVRVLSSGHTTLSP